MGCFNRFILRIRRPNSKAFLVIKTIVRALVNPTVFRLPRFVLPLFRLMYEIHFFAITASRTLLTLFYRGPLFQARCTSFGRDVTIEGLPYVDGHVDIQIGDNVRLGGQLVILSGSTFDQPRLVIKDRAAIGWNTKITVSKEVIIEEDAIVSYDCRISDTDGHRREADLRAAGVRPAPQDVLPIRICRHAWIGNGTHVMKGVTIGEGTIIGANSVVVSTIPPYSLALGNPAEVLCRKYGLPTTTH